VDESLEKLQLDRVDLLLLHWPGRTVPIAEQIALLNEVHAAGKTRHIGVSNQNVAQLQESVRHSAAPVVTNQIEVHPYIDQSRMISAARELGVSITAYYAMADGRVPEDPVLEEIGSRYGKTAAQVTLCWLIQQGIVTLSKTARPERVAENAAVFDFELSPDDMQKIAGLAGPDGRIINPSELQSSWD
jgi:2,5-diketo-D-gluconate reductase B